MPESLTKLERGILDYLIDYVRRHTYQPSIREIGKRFDIKSTKTVSEHLQVLADKGWIERDPTRSRGVRLLGVDLGAKTVTVPCYELGPDAASPTGVVAESFELDRKLAGSHDVFFVAMRGEGMESAGIQDGDLLLVEPVAGDALDGGDLVVVKLGGELRVQRYFQREDQPIPPSATPSYAPVRVGEDTTFALCGRVIGVFRRLRVPVVASSQAVAAPSAERETGS